MVEIEILADKTGYPLVHVPRTGIFTLWPVSRIQFEQFMYETNKYGDTWYDGVLRLLPRVSFKNVDRENYEGSFMAGVTWREALEFARWLSDGSDLAFDLPTASERRRLYRFLEKVNETLARPQAGLSPQAAVFWKRLGGFLKEPLEFALLEHGLMEWVKNHGAYGRAGHPRSGLQPNAWDSLGDVVPPSTRVREPNGFRLIARRPRQCRQ